jgi:hypothetical protein
MAEKNIGLAHAGMYVKSIDGRWIPFSGTIVVQPAEETEFAQLQNADDLTTIITYNEANSRGTVKNIVYNSPGLSMTATETFTSGTNTITIVRTGL